jgi:hypothetical protein
MSICFLHPNHPQFLHGTVHHSPNLYLNEMQEILEDWLGNE